MKTSNQILIGLVVLIFTIPIVSAFAIKAKVTKGQFSEQKFSDKAAAAVRFGTFAAYKAIVVKAPAGSHLACTLIKAEKPEYTYRTNQQQDSVGVTTINDTLYISYLGKKLENEQQPSISIDVYLPTVETLIVDGASVTLKQLQAEKAPIAVYIKNGGEIRDAGAADKKDISQVDTNAPTNTVIGNARIAYKPVSKWQTLVADNAAFTMPDWDVKSILVGRLIYRI